MAQDHLQSTKNKILKIWGGEPRSLDELAQCTIKMINRFEFGRMVSNRKLEIYSPEVVGFMWNIKRGSVSNSHSRPIGGVSNWGGDPDLPSRYPGWQGRVWIRYQTSPVSFASDPFSGTLTYPGTGGGGSYDGPWTSVNSWHYYARCAKIKDLPPRPEIYSWDYRFYTSDWPELDYYKLFDTMQGDIESRHIFAWEDAETKQQDQQFTDWCQGNQDVLDMVKTK